MYILALCFGHVGNMLGVFRPGLPCFNLRIPSLFKWLCAIAVTFTYRREYESSLRRKQLAATPDYPHMYRDPADANLVHTKSSISPPNWADFY